MVIGKIYEDLVYENWREQQAEMVINSFDAFIDVIINTKGYYYMSKRKLLEHLVSHCVFLLKDEFNIKKEDLTSFR
jgi:hypothetical protein